MHCPFCGAEETQVKDSRPSEDGSTIRRRRVCNECGARFTTFERIQLKEVSVITRSGAKTAFDRDKLARSIKLACRRRRMDDEYIETLVNGIQRRIETSTEQQEITSKEIASLVMKVLATVDTVAYFRYSTTYTDFREVIDFENFLRKLPKPDRKALDEILGPIRASKRKSVKKAEDSDEDFEPSLFNLM
jgi:transcriptional repressor NrdR